MWDTPEDFIEEAEKCKEEAVKELEQAEKENKAILLGKPEAKTVSLTHQATRLFYLAFA